MILCVRVHACVCVQGGWSRAPVLRGPAGSDQPDREQQERQKEEETVGNRSRSGGSGRSERRKPSPLRQKSGGIRHELGNGALGMFQLF